MPYLQKTLASIETQTFSDWQILAWDNGSTDGTVEELRRWIPTRLPGRVIYDRPCNELGASRAALVEMADTEFLALIDADDINLPERLARQVAFLTDHPKIALVGSQLEIIDQQGQYVRSYGFLPTDHDDLVNRLLAGSPLGQPSILLRRSAVLESGNYAPVDVEDYDLWLRLACSHRLANLEEVLLHYRVHPESTTVKALGPIKNKEATDACFYRHAETLFGCTKEEARFLRTQSLHCAIFLLWRICRHLQRTQRVPALSRLRSASFVSAARELLAPTDWLTLLILALLEPTVAAKVRALGHLTESVFLKLRMKRLAAILRRAGGAIIPYESAACFKPAPPEKTSSGNAPGGVERSRR